MVMAENAPKFSKLVLADKYLDQDLCLIEVMVGAQKWSILHKPDWSDEVLLERDGVILHLPAELFTTAADARAVSILEDDS